MLHSHLRVGGWAINVERTSRTYREEALIAGARSWQRPNVNARGAQCKPQCARSKRYEIWGQLRPAWITSLRLGAPEAAPESARPLIQRIRGELRTRYLYQSRSLWGERSNL